MIRLDNVSFYYEKQPVLNHVSLFVKKGQKLGVLGESGCGKSTLLKLMAGLCRPSSGTVTVDGESEPARICQKVSVVMQTPMLLPMTIRENITMGHEYTEEWIRHVCEEANLTKWIDTLPKGIDTYLGDRSDELSGGQAQRVAIARAMCKDAGILLLDEPTSALDPENAAAVLEALERYAKNRTIVHVTHRPEHLKAYDVVMNMDEL